MALTQTESFTEQSSYTFSTCELFLFEKIFHEQGVQICEICMQIKHLAIISHKESWWKAIY